MSLTHCLDFLWHCVHNYMYIYTTTHITQPLCTCACVIFVCARVSVAIGATGNHCSYLTKSVYCKVFPGPPCYLIKKPGSSQEVCCEVITETIKCAHMPHTHTHGQSVNHISLKNRPWCYTKSPTAQDAFRPIPGLISCTGVTRRWGLLSRAQNAVRWLHAHLPRACTKLCISIPFLDA